MKFALLAALSRSSVMCVALPTPLVAMVTGALLDDAIKSERLFASTPLPTMIPCGT